MPSHLLDQRRFYQASYCFADLLGNCSINAEARVNTTSVCTSLYALQQVEQLFQSREISLEDFLNQRFPKHWEKMTLDERAQLRIGLDTICQPNDQNLASHPVIKQLRTLVTESSIQDMLEQAKTFVLEARKYVRDPDTIHIINHVNNNVIKRLYLNNHEGLENPLCKQDASFRFMIIRMAIIRHMLDYDDEHIFTKLLTELSSDNHGNFDSSTPSWLVLSSGSEAELQGFNEELAWARAKSEHADAPEKQHTFTHTVSLKHTYRAAALYAKKVHAQLAAPSEPQDATTRPVSTEAIKVTTDNYEKNVLPHLAAQFRKALTDTMAILTTNFANPQFLNELLLSLDTFMPEADIMQSNNFATCGHREKIIRQALNGISAEKLEKLSAIFRSTMVAASCKQMENEALLCTKTPVNTGRTDMLAYIRRQLNRIEDLKQLQCILTELRDNQEQPLSQTL